MKLCIDVQLLISFPCSTFFIMQEQNIHELKTHNKWLELERSFQLNVSNLNSKKKAQQIMQNYLEQTDALKDQIQVSN